MKTKFNAVTMMALALAAMASTAMGSDKAAVNDHDAKFIKEAAAGGTAEVKLAELGVKKASRADVKEFAQMMVTDHTAVNKELTALAKSKGVDISATVDSSAAAKFQKMEKYATGKEFDDAFIKDMKADHKKTISDFESAQKNVKDGDLKAFVDKTLPSLKGHLDHVEKLAGK